MTGRTIRWATSGDKDAILDIDRLSYREPWTEADLRRTLAARNTLGMVYDVPEGTLGFMVYRLDKGAITIERFAVHPDYRRRGIGTALMRTLANKLHRQRSRLAVVAHEADLHAHLFLQACGFQAIRVLRGHFDDGSDGYGFLLTRAVAAATVCVPTRSLT